MPNFSQAAGQVVASDIISTFTSIDGAVHDAARLASNFIEACNNSELPPARSQKVLRSLADGISKEVDGRAELINAQRALVTIKKNSNLDVYDFGCWMMEDTQPARCVAPVTVG